MSRPKNCQDMVLGQEQPVSFHCCLSHIEKMYYYSINVIMTV